MNQCTLCGQPIPKKGLKQHIDDDRQERLKLELRSVDEAIAWMQGPEGEAERLRLLQLRWKIRNALGWNETDNPKPPKLQLTDGS